jgi:hypothetical protein
MESWSLAFAQQRRNKLTSVRKSVADKFVSVSSSQFAVRSLQFAVRLSGALCIHWTWSFGSNIQHLRA